VRAIGATVAGWLLASRSYSSGRPVVSNRSDTESASPDDDARPDEPWWLERICAVPTLVSTTVEAASSESALLEQLVGDQQPLRFALSPLPGPHVGSGDIVLMVVYPSDAVRSLTSEVTVDEDRIEFLVEDRSVFLDPRGPSLALGEPGLLRMTVFAVDCGGVDV
jgi:hypothetical protein